MPFLTRLKVSWWQGPWSSCLSLHSSTHSSGWHMVYINTHSLRKARYMWKNAKIFMVFFCLFLCFHIIDNTTPSRRHLFTILLNITFSRHFSIHIWALRNCPVSLHQLDILALTSCSFYPVRATDRRWESDDEIDWSIYYPSFCPAGPCAPL